MHLYFLLFAEPFAVGFGIGTDIVIVNFGIAAPVIHPAVKFHPAATVSAKKDASKLVILFPHMAIFPPACNYFLFTFFYQFLHFIKQFPVYYGLMGSCHIDAP